jgi:hypothetical protein
MPTCSQAKIITNLETDIQKRLFALTRAGGGLEGGGGGGIAQYGDPIGENFENDENFYETIQNLNIHHQQQQQQYSPTSTSHQNANYNNLNDLNDINNKSSSLATNTNVNENFKLYQSFHRPTKTLTNPSVSTITNTQTTSSSNGNNNLAAITSNTPGRKLGALKNQSINNNNSNDSKSINTNGNNVIISNG